MKKILIVTHKIPSWRLPFYNKLISEKNFDIKIYYSGEENNLLDNNSFIYLSHKKVLKKFYIQDINKIDFLESYRIILLFDLHFLTNLLIWWKFKNKVMFWGIGLGKNHFFNLIRSFLVYKSNGLISYMNKVHSSWYYKFINKDKLFYMSNTIDNILKENIFSKNSNKIVIIGSLDRRKNYDLAFKVVAKLVKVYNYSIRLNVVGDGEEYKNLHNLAKELNIQDIVTFYGRVNEENKIKSILNESLFVVSPGQAGLSVMHSFSYGLPFITYKNCITGGELEHITNGYNGVIVKELSVKAFVREIKILLDDKEKLSKLSRNAFSYYLNNDMNLMVKRFLNAIN